MRELVHASRSLRHRPGFAAAVVLTVALAVGVSTSLFTLVNELVLRPVAGVQGRGLVNLYVTEDGALQGLSGHSYPTFRDFTERQQTLDGVAAFAGRGFGLEHGGATELVGGQLVSARFFELLGTRPALGRLLSSPDSGPGSDAVVVSHRLWQERFGADPGLPGRPVRVNGHTFTVVGVAEPGFRGHFIGFPSDLFVPLLAAPRVAPDLDLEDRAADPLELIGRTRPGQTTGEVQADLDRVAAQLAREFPDALRTRGVSVREWTGLDADLSGSVLGFVGVLGAVAGLVLVIACVNTAGLLHHRSQTRRRETALRLALGAGRGTLVRQLLAETLLLFAAGGGLGLLLAATVTDLLHAFLPAFPIPVRLDLAVDWRVAVFATVVALASAIAFGLAPALSAARIDVIAALKPGTGESSRSRARIRRALVTAQVGVSLVLLVTAALFVRVLLNVQSLETGFTTAHVGIASVDVRVLSRGEPVGRAFFEAWLERFERHPGVAAAGLARALPLGFGASSDFVRVDGLDSPDPRGFRAGWNAVTPGYLRALDIPLVQGRHFTDADGPDAESVAIVSRSTAERLFPSHSPIGRYLRHDAGSLRIVGVAGDIASRRPGEVRDLFFYVPFAQRYSARMTLVVRGREGIPLEEMRGAVRALDPDLPVLALQPLAQHTGAVLFPQRMAAAIAGGFGLLGLVLAAVGLYGVMAFLATERRRELAIRLALGARNGEVRQLVLREGLMLVMAGLALGVPAALLLARAAQQFLPGITPWDPPAFTAAAVLLTTVTLLAADLPARRVAAADPMTALRSD